MICVVFDVETGFLESEVRAAVSCSCELRRERERVCTVIQYVIPHCFAQLACARWHLAELQRVRKVFFWQSIFPSCCRFQAVMTWNQEGPLLTGGSPFTVRVISTVGSDSLCDLTEGLSCQSSYPQAALSFKDAKWQAWGLVRFYFSAVTVSWLLYFLIVFLDTMYGSFTLMKPE